MKPKRIYRRSRRSDTWHFIQTCSRLPQKDYIETSKRAGGELCNECQAKSKKGGVTL